MQRNNTHEPQALNAKEVVKAYLAAFAKGNIEEMLCLLDENVVWHIDGDPAVSTVGLLQGQQKVRHWLESFPENFRPQKFIINDLIEHNESVLLLGQFRHTVLSTGNAVGSDMVIHFKVSRSKITRYQIFEDSALLSRAFNVEDKWQQQQIRVNGTLYRYRDCGEGPTLFFAHGLFVNHEIFSAQVRSLSQTHRCIVLDMPGHGQSGYSPDGWTLDDLSRDLALMIQELSLGSVTFIGQSQGGMVGIRLAATQTQHVSGLVLIGTSARAEFPERLEHWRSQRDILCHGPDRARKEQFEAIQEQINGRAWLENNPVAAAHERNIMLSHDRKGLALALDAAVFTRGDIRALLPDIQVPTLIICGEEDSATPVELSHEMADTIPDAKMVILAKTGHHPPVEDAPGVTAAIVEFLQSGLFNC